VLLVAWSLLELREGGEVLLVAGRCDLIVVLHIKNLISLMGAGSSKKLSKALQSKLQQAVGVNERVLNILYNRFIYLYIKGLPEGQREQAYKDVERTVEKAKVPISSIRLLKEF